MNKPASSAIRFRLLAALMTGLCLSDAIAFDLTPDPMSGTEGDIISFQASITGNDWTYVGNDTGHPCNMAGFEYSFDWSTLTLGGSTATWGVGGDLLLNLMGSQHPPPTVIPLDPECTNDPDDIMVQMGSVEMLTDQLAEPDEFGLISVAYCVGDPGRRIASTLDSAGSNRPDGSGPPTCSNETIEIIVNDLPPPTASVVAVEDAVEPDQDGQFSIRLNRAAPSGGVTVNYDVSGSASPGVDYESLDGSAFIPAGSSSVAVDVEVIDDENPESTETVVLTLTSGSGYLIGTGSATVNILDDQDNVASVSAVRSAVEPDQDGLFTINLAGPADPGGLTISYGVSGSATADEDYVALSGTAFIPEGESSVGVAVVVIDDSELESTETVVLTLIAGPGYSLGASSATIAIRDDDTNSVSIAATADAAEPAQNGEFTVTVNPVSQSDVTINYNVGGTASPGQDYQALSGSVTVPAGSSTATIAVLVIDDEIAEGDEDVVVSIMAPPNYAISGTGIATVIIHDDEGPGINVNPISGLTVDEGGSTDTFTVVLNSEPAADVTIPVQSSNVAEGTVSPNSLTFTPGNWDVPQVVTVTGVADGVDDGATAFTIMLMPAQSADPFYSGIDPQDVSVTNLGSIPGTVQFVMDTYTVAESDGTATIDIERVGGDTGELTAQFATADSGSDNAATAGDDYQATTVNLTWANGEMGIRTVEVPVFDNDDIPVVLENGIIVEDVRLELTRNGELLDSAELIIESEASDDVDAIITDGTETPNQREIARVISASCPQLNNEPDFQDLCTAIVVSAANNNDVVPALQGATPDDAAAVRSSGMQTSNVQATAIDGRLGTIRGGGGAGFSASGFSASYGDVTFTGNLVRDFIASFDQNTPEFMQASAGNLNAGQANVGQSDTSVLDEFGRWGVWVSGRIVFGEKDFSTNQIDYDFDTAGLTGGIDYRFTDKFVAGVAVGYANTDAKMGSNNGDLDTDGYSVSLYGNWFNDNQVYIAGSLGWGGNDYSQTRNVQYVINQPGGVGLPASAFNVNQSMEADYDGSQFSAAVTAGWDFNKDGLTFGPRIGASLVDVSVDAYDERLVMSNQANAINGWAVHIDDQDYESLEVNLGFELSKAMSQSWGVLIPQGYVDVVSELKDGPTPVTGRFLGDLNNVNFTLMTDDFEETFVRAGLGLGFIFQNNKSAFFMVDGDFGRDLLKTYYINAGFRWQF